MTGNEANLALSRVREALEDLRLVDGAGPNDVADGFELMDRLTAIVLRWNAELRGEQQFVMEDAPHEPELNPLSLAAQAEYDDRENWQDRTRW